MIPKMHSLPSDICAECWAKIKTALKAEKERRAEKSRPRREAKRAKREARNEVMGQLRVDLMNVAGYACERCSAPQFADTGHAHHLYGGSGRRRVEERVETLAWLCPACHRSVHAHPVGNKALREAIAAKREARR